MKKGTLKKWLTALCTVLSTLSLFAIPAFAEEANPAKKGLSTGTIVTLIVTGVIVLAAVVLCIVFREKVKKFLRVYKSEVKKIVWLPWNQTRKSTLVVVVVLVVCAAAICLIDAGLNKGFIEFIGLFTKA